MVFLSGFYLRFLAFSLTSAKEILLTDPTPSSRTSLRKKPSQELNRTSKVKLAGFRKHMLPFLMAGASSSSFVQILPVLSSFFLNQNCLD